MIFPSVMATTQQQRNLLYKKYQNITQTLHLDVGDGKFVPTVVNFPDFRLSRNFSYNVHLMIKHPQKWIKQHGHKFHTIIFHPEAIKNPQKIIHLIQQKRRKVGLALKPQTPISSIKPYLNQLDTLLILTVNPGYYGAKFLKRPLQKIKQVKAINPKIEIIVDGAMTPTTAPLAKRAGADHLVSGSLLARSDNPKKAMQELKRSFM